MAERTEDDTAQRGDRWHRRRDAIIDTSAYLFAQRGYDATGTADLCDANELGKGALYHYIGSKERLLAAIFDRVMDEVMAGADRAEDGGGTATERLVRLGEELLDVIGRFPDHVWIALHEFRALTGERATEQRERRRSFEQRIEALLVEGIGTGEFREIDAHVAALGWLGMHNYSYRWLQTENVSAQQVATTFADIVIRGLANPVHGAE